MRHLRENDIDWSPVTGHDPITQMKLTRTSVQRTVESLLEIHDARKATMYLDENTVVTATRRHKHDSRSEHTEILLKLGKPNYRERMFIRACKKAGEPMPVRKVQLKYWPQ